jgi:hypothetical protein
VRRALITQECEPLAQCLGRVELFHRQHRPEAMPELDHPPAFHRRAAAINHHIVVAISINRELEHLTGPDRAELVSVASAATGRPRVHFAHRHRPPVVDRFGYQDDGRP